MSYSPKSTDALMPVDFLEAADNTRTLHAKHLHSHFEDVRRVGNGAGNDACDNCTTDIDKYILLTRGRQEPFQRIISSKFNCPVRRLPQYCWNYSKKEVYKAKQACVIWLAVLFRSRSGSRAR